MSTINPQTAARLFKIKRHQLEMVRDRGYDISQEEPLFEYQLDDFIREYSEILDQRNASIREANRNAPNRRSVQNELTFRQMLNRVYAKDDGTRLLVHYAESPPRSNRPSKLGVEPIGEFIRLATDSGVQWAILISEQDISSEAARNLQDIKIIYFQHFFDEELMYNPTKHFMVPRHEALTETDARAFLRDNNLKPSQLPILKYVDPLARPTEKDKDKVTDPIVKYYGLLPGQIVRIHRENFVTETLVDSYIIYRQVYY
jgi:DNA-directed RNA polymerase I, II, and III subunit RPABC1